MESVQLAPTPVESEMQPVTQEEMAQLVDFGGDM